MEQPSLLNFRPFKSARNSRADLPCNRQPIRCINNYYSSSYYWRKLLVKRSRYSKNSINFSPILRYSFYRHPKWCCRPFIQSNKTNWFCLKRSNTNRVYSKSLDEYTSISMKFGQDCLSLFKTYNRSDDSVSSKPSSWPFFSFNLAIIDGKTTDWCIKGFYLHSELIWPHLVSVISLNVLCTKSSSNLAYLFVRITVLRRSYLV